MHSISCAHLSRPKREARLKLLLDGLPKNVTALLDERTASGLRIPFEICEIYRKQNAKKAGQTSKTASGLRPLVEHLLAHTILPTATSSKRDLFGPSPQQRSEQQAYSVLLSLFALSKLPTSSARDIPPPPELDKPSAPPLQPTDALLVFAKKMREKHLPPRRLAISASLCHLAGISLKERTTYDDELSLLSWLWQEWTLLRENDPAGHEDEIILAGFLESVDKFPKWEVLPSAASQDEGAGDAATGVEDADQALSAWQKQIIAVGIDDAALQSSTAWRGGINTPYQDPPTHISSRNLLRALASACLRDGRWDLALDCLYDPRLPSGHVGPLLHRLSLFVLRHHQLDPDTRHFIVSAMSRSVRQLEVSPRRAERRIPPEVILVLLQHGHYEHVREYLTNLAPTDLGVRHLRPTYLELIAQGKHELLAELYSRVPRDVRRRLPLWNLIASHSKVLSDLVWQDVTSIKGLDDAELDNFLQARLVLLQRRDRRFPNLSLARKDLDFFTAKTKSQPAPTTLKLFLHILLRAGKRPEAEKLYQQNKHTWSAEDLQDVHNMFLTTANVRFSRFWSSRGAEGWLNRVNREYARLASEEGAQPDGVTANILLKNTLGWTETTRESIWAALHDGLKGKNRDWHREIKHLYDMTIDAFLKKGLAGDAREVAIMKAKHRDAETRKRQGFRRWASSNTVRVRR